ncbi:MAG TPA: tRNA guanosine(34) transglycosylase Tgt [Candidatus Saccharimonadales bacterium]|nr:tRNA guanosine(34) transglycosylase Tgt [Candidatus Saccharimonadales bacterium]
MSQAVFKQTGQSAAGARLGVLKTRRGPVKTPFFMPVATRGVVKSLTPKEVKDTGAQVLLSNTYHLHLQPGEELVKRLGGLAKFNGWEGPTLTDSGGFQVFSLASIRKITEEGVTFKEPKTGDEIFISPEKSMQIQFSLGSDIIMAFDDLTGLSLETRARTKEAMERTHRWLARCLTEFNRLTKDLPDGQKPLLFGISQGGLDEKLREKSLDFVQSQPVDGVAIGGLSVGESRAELHSMLKFMSLLYDPARPRYLMGVGHPIDFRWALLNGIDMMDCVMPTRNGRHGTVWLKGDRPVNLKSLRFATDKQIIDKTCDCYTCRAGYSRALLRHLFKNSDPLAGRLASIHNLRYLARICEEI